MKTTSILSTLTSGALVLGLCASGTAQTSGKTGETRPAAPKGAEHQPGMASDSHAMSAPARASQVIGTEIRYSNGETFAEISDLVVGRSGELIALVKRSDSLLVGVPLSGLEARMDDEEHGNRDARAMSDDERNVNNDDMDETPEAKAKAKARGDMTAKTETPEVEHFVMACDRTKCDAAPTVKSNELVDAAWLERSVSYFTVASHAASNDPNAPKKGTDAANPVRPSGDLSATKTTFVKELIGQDLETSTGDNVGSVEDIAVDLDSGRIAYAIISLGGVLGMGESMHAIAFERLTVNDDTVTTTLTKDNISQLAKLDLDNLAVVPPGSLSMNSTRPTDHTTTDR